MHHERPVEAGGLTGLQKVLPSRPVMRDAGIFDFDGEAAGFAQDCGEESEISGEARAGVDGETGDQAVGSDGGEGWFGEGFAGAAPHGVRQGRIGVVHGEGCVALGLPVQQNAAGGEGGGVAALDDGREQGGAIGPGAGDKEFDALWRCHLFCPCGEGGGRVRVSESDRAVKRGA